MSQTTTPINQNIPWYSSIFNFFASRFGESSSIVSLAGAVGTGVGLALGTVSLPVAIPVFIGAAVGVLLPQTSQATRTDIVSAVNTAINAGQGIANVVGKI